MLKEIFILLNAWAGIISLILIVIFWLKLRRCDKRVDLILNRIIQLEWKKLHPEMSKPLEKEFKYYIENQNKLVKRYNNKYVVVKNKKVIGVYDSEAEAVQETSKNEPLGTFLVQKCTLGEKDYTVTLHSNSNEGLKKELKKQAKETAKLNLEICDEFKYVDGENL